MSRRMPVSRFRFLVPASFGLVLVAIASAAVEITGAMCSFAGKATKCTGEAPPELMWMLLAGTVVTLGYAAYQAYRDFVCRDYQAENMLNGHW